MGIDESRWLESNIRDRFHRLGCSASLSGGLSVFFISLSDSVSSPSSERRDQLHDHVAAFLYHAPDHVSTIFQRNLIFFRVSLSGSRRGEENLDARSTLPSRSGGGRKVAAVVPALRLPSPRPSPGNPGDAIEPDLRMERKAAGVGARGGAPVVPGVGLEPTRGFRPEGF